MYLECENVSKHEKVRHSAFSYTANESGMMIQTNIQDCILFKYSVDLAPSSIKLWFVHFLNRRLGKWLLKCGISVVRSSNIENKTDM